MQDIIISNPEELQQKIKNFVKAGSENLHILSDFDRTLTQGIVQGKRSATLIAYIRNGKYLTSDYPKKAYNLFDKYHPIEIDPTISLETKKEKMEEWWKAHNELLIKSGLDMEVFKDIIKKNNLFFRKGCLDFFDLLNQETIPLIIMSASRAELIKGFLEKENKFYKNTHIIANNFIWDKENKAIGSREPVIHTFNKTETELKHLPIYNELLKRKNIILLGDSLGDTGMSEGFPYNNIIKIGFLNENQEQNLEAYKKSFDILITNDGSFEYINNLLKKII